MMNLCEILKCASFVTADEAEITSSMRQKFSFNRLESWIACSSLLTWQTKSWLQRLDDEQQIHRIKPSDKFNLFIESKEMPKKHLWQKSMKLAKILKFSGLLCSWNLRSWQLWYANTSLALFGVDKFHKLHQRCHNIASSNWRNSYTNSCEWCRLKMIDCWWRKIEHFLCFHLLSINWNLTNE